MFRTTHEYSRFANMLSHSRMGYPTHEFTHSPVGYHIREWNDPLVPHTNRSSGVGLSYSYNIVTIQYTTLNSQLSSMATPATAVIASINPFPNDVRIAFQSYIQSPDYINRERVPYEKWNRMHIHLDTPDLKPDNVTNSRLKYRAYTEFQLVNNKLFRRPDSKFLNMRYTVPESEVFDTIANEHLQLLHAGQIKTWAAVQQKYLWNQSPRSYICLEAL